MGKRFDRRRQRGGFAGTGPDDAPDAARDAADPAQFFSPHTDGGRGDRKVHQICKEVERTLGYALAACGDALLGELCIVAVEPAPDASRLMVSLYAPRAGLPASELLERLDHVKGHFRQEVAAALQRKRTPELCFRLAAPSLGDEQPRGDDEDGGGSGDGDEEGWE